MSRFRPGAGGDGAAVRSAGGRGQGLVEFAVVLPVFLLMLFGLIDGGRLVYLNSTLSQAAREGARLGSVEAGWVGSTDAGCGQTGGPTCPSSVDDLRAHVRTAVNRMVSPFASIPTADVFLSCDPSIAPTGAWTAQTCLSRTSGSVMSVRVVYVYGAMTPVLGQILGSLTLSGSATMVIN